MTNAYAVLYLEINLVSVILVGIILFKTQGLSKMVAQRTLSAAIITEIVFFMSDTFFVLMSSGMLPYSRAAALALKEIYFFATAVVCYFWFLYFEYMQDAPFVKVRRRVLLSFGMAALMGLLLIVNLKNGMFFYIGEDNVYHRGPLFILQYILSYSYVVITCSRALLGFFQKDHYMDRGMLITLSVFPLAPAFAGIIQFVRPDLPVACVALSIATLVLYLNWTDQMISIDPLTKLNNRKQLDYHFRQWARMSGDHSPMYMILIDADKFKSINDTYGHAQGDAALKCIAEALRKACQGLQRRANIARYGGDEFVILMEADSEDIVKDVRKRIYDILETLNSESGAPFHVSVSAGIAKASPTQELKDLIVQADEKMYEEKQSKRR